jgi:hypothetical protein
VPTSILYKADALTSAAYRDKKLLNRDSFCWGYGVPRHPKQNDICIPNIKQYMMASLVNEKLEKLKLGLTIKKVVSDYLKVLHELGIRRLKENRAFARSTYYIDFKPEKIRYCLICDQDQEDFVRDCFIEAGIINGSDPDNRLTFATMSEAAAYNYLGWNGSVSGTNAGEKYLVCDIGHSSVSISRIQLNTTLSTSEVVLVDTYPKLGSVVLENNLREYLQLNSRQLYLNQKLIEDVVDEFLESTKVPCPSY